MLRSFRFTFFIFYDVFLLPPCGFILPHSCSLPASEDVDARWWKNVLLTVVNRKDPLPAMISATLDPTLLDGQDEQVARIYF